MTHHQRVAITIEPLRSTLKRLRKDDKQRAHLAAHIERLELIYKPFPVVRRLGTGSALPWGGTIVTDTFYGDVHGQRRPGGGARDEGYENYVERVREDELEALAE